MMRSERSRAVWQSSCSPFLSTLPIAAMACAIALAASPTRAIGVTMVGAEFDAFGDFYSVDVQTGGVSTIGATDGFFGGMDVAPDGTLWAAGGLLHEVNPATGLAITGQTITFVGAPADDVITGLSFSSTGDLFGIGSGTGNLWAIDTTTAQATLIGSSGQSIFSLEFGPGGVLYGAGTSLWQINPATGAATEIGSFFTTEVILITALDFASDGVMYAASLGTTTDTLYRLDLSTAAAQPIAVTGANLVSLASDPIPEPATPVLAAIALLTMFARRPTRATTSILSPRRGIPSSDGQLGCAEWRRPGRA